MWQIHAAAIFFFLRFALPFADTMCFCAFDTWLFHHHSSSLSVSLLLLEHPLSIPMCLCVAALLVIYIYIMNAYCEATIWTHSRTPRIMLMFSANQWTITHIPLLFIADENTNAVSIQLAVAWQWQANEIPNESIGHIEYGRMLLAGRFILFSIQFDPFAAYYQFNWTHACIRTIFCEPATSIGGNRACRTFTFIDLKHLKVYH